MGTWGTAPWDNDYAADWFSELFDVTGLAGRVEQTLQFGFDEADHEEIRAAAAVLIVLGHPYVWPIDDLDRHLELAATRLKEMLPFFDDAGAFADILRAEIAVLEARRERLRRARAGEAENGAEPETADPLPWRQF